MRNSCEDEQVPNTSGITVNGLISPTTESFGAGSVVVDEDHQRQLLPNHRIKSPKPDNNDAGSNKKRMRRFSCDLCDERFYSHCDLKRHKSSIHEKASQFLCPIKDCRRSRRGFVRKDNLAAHLRNVHKLHDEQELLREALVTEEADSTSDSSSNAAEEQPIASTNEQRHAIFGERFEPTDGQLKFVNKDRRRYEMEKAKRRELEKELQRLRERYEAREEMWLNLFTKTQST